MGSRLAVAITGDTGDICCHFWQHVLVVILLNHNVDEFINYDILATKCLKMVMMKFIPHSRFPPDRPLGLMRVNALPWMSEP